MIRKFEYVILAMIFTVHNVKSQYYFYNDKYYNSGMLVETGISTGGMNCLTDLGGKTGEGKGFLKDINWNHTHPCAGIYLEVLFDELFGVRAEAGYGKISAADKVLKDDQSPAKDRYLRNLHFQSTVAELALMIDIFPFSFFNKDRYPLLCPYVTGGAGLFRFNPKAEMEGQWVNLHPLHTEGQGFAEYPENQEYRLIQVEFPMGLGLRYELSAIVDLRFEIVYRFLNTDYLDDVSRKYINPAFFQTNLPVREARYAQMLADRSGELQPGSFRSENDIRGNPENKDGYFSCNLKFGFILNRKRR